MFEEKGIEQSGRPSERCALERVDRQREIDQTTLRREIEQSERAGDAQTSVPGHAKAIPLIDQQQVGVGGFRQGDR